MNTEEMMYDLLKTIDSKQDQQSERLTRLEEHVSKNTIDLEEHIEGVKQTRKLIAQHDKEYKKRFEVLEEPKKTAVSIGKFLKWAFGIITVIAGGVYGLIRLYKL